MAHYGLKPEDLTVVPLGADEINPQAQLVPFKQVAAMRVPRPYT